VSAPDNQIPAPSTIPDAEAAATAVSDAEADTEIGHPAILSPSNHPYAEIFPMMDGAAFDDLVADIKANGQREAIIMLNGMILDGRNRYRACEQAGVTPICKEFDPEIDGKSPLAFVFSKNLKRRHLNEGQRAMIGANLANMPLGGAVYRSAILPTDMRVSQADAAEMLNVSERSIRDAVKVKNEAEPELVKAVQQGRLAVSAAAKAATLPKKQQRDVARAAEAGEPRAVSATIKKAARAQREADLGRKQMALPLKRYGVILADPEWEFQVWNEDTGSDRSAENHYPTSTLGEIKKRDVPSIAADDSVLFLWATPPMLPQALEVMAAWGFEYRSQVVWAKPKTGTGYWFRARHELLLVGVRGNIPAPAPGTQFASVIEKKTTHHSAKPEVFHKLIETYFPTLPKIELNRRGPPRAHWDSWGLEAESPEQTGGAE
jgi:N6-adenosine-specific RNA methylase IME4